jgi:hypothetical protein
VGTLLSRMFQEQAWFKTWVLTFSRVDWVNFLKKLKRRRFSKKNIKKVSWFVTGSYRVSHVTSGFFSLIFSSTWPDSSPESARSRVNPPNRTFKTMLSRLMHRKVIKKKKKVKIFHVNIIISLKLFTYNVISLFILILYVNPNLFS